ncbi:hypothetical protein [Lentzea sp. NPDC003310]|uniref:hypothetical protein n=1 Tax=Lentzea sp. NPDC003310 TaxID=3154447 RepID=UPI0033A727FE
MDQDSASTSLGSEVKEVSKTPAGKLSRWFFCLPVVLPFPDRTQLVDHIGNQPRSDDAEDTPIVSIVIHQITQDAGRLSAMGDAVFEAVSRDPQIMPTTSTEEQQQARMIRPNEYYTVVEAMTNAKSPDQPDADWTGDPQDLPPRADPLMRCLRYIDDLTRAFRLAVERPQPRPLYPTISGPILCYHADGEVTSYEHEDGRILNVLQPVGTWEGPQLVLPNHNNFLLDASPPEPGINGPLAERFTQWLGSIRIGDRQIGWSERFLEAREALYSRGEAGQAVVLASTAAEVLVTSILTTLLWEDKVPTAVAASAWEDGKIVPAILKQLAPRLKGTWKTDQGALGHWYQRAYRLRHRVVHGGYEPTRPEAVAALEATHALSQFIFDRVVAQRGVYPRTTLMTVAASGLEKRGLWTGKIKAFAEQVAPTEPLWKSALVRYNDELVRERLKTLK